MKSGVKEGDGFKYDCAIGINGGGRMGKGLLRYCIANKIFSEIVINFGREVGQSFDDVVNYILTDTIYGSLHAFTFGSASGKRVSVEWADDSQGLVTINGVKIHILRTNRNPININWGNCIIIVDATGQYNRPNKAADAPEGSVRGHLRGDVKKVLVSSPFKDIDEGMPEDAVMLVEGINNEMYNPQKHNIISAASCTTTCLAHMIKPLFDAMDVSNLLCMALTTVHAATGKQPHMDCVPATGAGDLVTSRSAGGNIFLSTTGAAKALQLIMPEICHVVRSAESVRVDTLTGSLCIVTMDWSPNQILGRDNATQAVNNIFREAAKKDSREYLKYNSHNSVVRDVVSERAAAVVQGTETVVGHVLDAKCEKALFNQVRLFGWYDNEMGYIRMMNELLMKVASDILE